MNKKLTSLTLILVLISCGGGGDDLEVTQTEPIEQFANWSPDFSEQTSNFTQTRTGTQGSQQTRTIVVTSSSISTDSDEETVELDINNDDDLFEDIEVVITTYTGSENLGSHQQTTYNVTEDNDMGLRVGNNFYSLLNGVLEDYGPADDGCDGCDTTEEECNLILSCQGNTLYNLDLTLFSEGISFSSSNGFSGEGQSVSLELWGSKQNDLLEGTYSDYINRFNSLYQTNFSHIDFVEVVEQTNEESVLENWIDEQFDCGGLFDGSSTQTICNFYNVLNLASSNNSFELNGSPDSGTNAFEYINGEFLLSKGEDDRYTLKMTNGRTVDNLPISLYFKGYLGYNNVDSNKNSNAKTNKKGKSKLF